MQVRDVMTANVISIPAQATILEAAHDAAQSGQRPAGG
jgi:hypothetical protein